MLPLPLNLHDPMGQAKSGQLPSPIDVTGAEPVFPPRVGELYYWAPSHTVAIFYDDLGQSVPRLAWSVSESWTAASPRSARPVTDSPSGSSWLTAQSADGAVIRTPPQRHTSGSSGGALARPAASVTTGQARPGVGHGTLVCGHGLDPHHFARGFPTRVNKVPGQDSQAA